MCLNLMKVGLCSNSMKIDRIYTGEQGDSFFDNVEINLSSAGEIGALSEPWQADRVIFRTNEGDYNYDWHNAPARQLVVMLEGGVEIEVSSGEKRIFHPGDILLVEDLTGKGHRARALGGQPRKSMFVVLK